MRIAPVSVHLVDPHLAVRVSGPAFDSMTPEARRALRMRDPFSWLHAMQPPEEHGSVDGAMRASAREVGRLMSEGVFNGPLGEHLFLYRLSDGAWSQTGVVADGAATEYENGTVLPHEGTRPEQVHQLVRHLEVVGVSSSPIAVAYRSTESIVDLVAAVELLEPLLSFESSDGLRQEVWAIPDDLVVAFVAAFEEVEHAYITDGHHRSQAAVAYSRGEGPSARGGPRSPNVFTVLFADDHLKIVEFNRIVHDVPDPSRLQRILSDWGARPVQREAARPVRQGQIGVWVSGFWYVVDVPLDPSLGPPDSLDPARLQDLLLGPVLGIDDPTSDPRLEYVPGSVTLADLEHRARSGAGFVLAPVALADMMSVSDAGGRMPPKSTYFEPKVRSGIFLALR